MTEGVKPESSELVLRALVRLLGELDTRQPKDEDDFVRRKQYRKTGRPENGMSLFRKNKFDTMQAVWDRLGMRNPVGLSECVWRKLEAKGFKCIIGAEQLEHVSLRCPECDMSEFPNICKPINADDHTACPFFDIDSFDLEPDFDLIEVPAQRNLTARPGAKK